jgi:hypothetical protein
MVIELTGYFESLGRHAEVTYEEGLRRIARGYGDDPELVEASIRKARRRARRAGAA